MGERYKMVTKRDKRCSQRKIWCYSKTIQSRSSERNVSVTQQPITCRPADLLENELGKLEGEMAQYKEQDEDVLSYALFPQVATDFFKYRQAQEKRWMRRLLIPKTEHIRFNQ